MTFTLANSLAGSVRLPHSLPAPRPGADRPASTQLQEGGWLECGTIWAHLEEARHQECIEGPFPWNSSANGLGRPAEQRPHGPGVGLRVSK